MAHYMIQFTFTPEAWAALLRKPEDRTAAVKALLETLGGKLVSYHYCFGEYDGVIISECPDSLTAMAGVLASYSGGHLRAIRTTELFTTAEAVQAMMLGSHSPGGNIGLYIRSVYQPQVHVPHHLVGLF